MRKIVIAGAGHGGLSAAINLARAGFDVSVYEKNAREDMGYDWTDATVPRYLPMCGFRALPEDKKLSFSNAGFLPPSMKVMANTDVGPSKHIFAVDRKYLLATMIEQCEAEGVRFCFGSEVTAPFVKKNRVKGIVVGGEVVAADLVIDSAGMDSPVRRNLPPNFHILSEISAEDTVWCYRAFYERKTDECSDPKYKIYFFHNNVPGMDWVITEDEYIDIFVGTFRPITQADVDASVADFRRLYPYMGEKIVRGGTFAKIPLRKTLPRFVAPGYAAIGDAACMTEPLSGSGIYLSVRAGKMLADVCISDPDGDFGIGTMWKYEYRYMKEIGNGYLTDAAIKGMLASVNADDINFLMENNILSEKELKGGSGYNVREIAEKLRLLGRPKLIPPVVNMALKLAKLGAIKAALPSSYDRKKLAEFERLYFAI